MKTSLKLIMITSLVFLSACASRSKKAQNTEPPPIKEAQTEPGPLDPNEVKADWSKAKQMDDNAVLAGPLTPAKEVEAEDVPMNTSNTEYVGNDVPKKLDSDEALSAEFTKKKVMAATKAPKKKAKTAGVEAEKARLWLEHGNTRFVKHHLRKDGQGAADRARTAKNQTPHSTVFACSDSRVSPELIFDQKLGEIYVVRTSGLAVDQAVISSLEEAADKLGTQLFVILGNSDCGDASKAADEIMARSALLAEKVNTGEIKLAPATYDLKSGVVKFQ